jgi:hypothetical protein
MGEFARSGLVNLVGGCCGTTPDHIRSASLLKYFFLVICSQFAPISVPTFYWLGVWYLICKDTYVDITVHQFFFL